jgi:hypothetical protein
MSGSKVQAKPLPATWKEALYESVHGSDQPAKAVADDLGVSRQMLSACCDETSDTNLSSKHLTALARATSNLSWLDYLEAIAGRQAFMLPTANALCSVMTVAALKEFSEFLTTVADSVADGSVSPEDAARIEREGLDAISAIQTVIATARRQAPPSGEQAGPSSVVRGGRS